MHQNICDAPSMRQHAELFISVRLGTNKQQGDFERFNLGNGGRIVKDVINNRLGPLL